MNDAPGRTRLKVANAFSCGEHQLLWLAGGLTVYRKSDVEEMYSTLDEASKAHPLDFVHDPSLMSELKNGYLVPGDESDNWPIEFQVVD